MPNLGQPWNFYFDTDGNPTVVLRFDKLNHVYLRETPTGLVPTIGVTSALHIIDKSERLIPWAAKVVVEKLIKNTPVDLDVNNGSLIVPAMSYEQFEAIANAAKSAPKDLKEDAGSIGSIAHECLEHSIKFALHDEEHPGVVVKLVKPPKNDMSFHCACAALDWTVQHRVQWKRTERKIYSKLYDYAGTMDGLALVSSCDNPVCCPTPFTDALSIIDWKSSNYLYCQYGYQTAAYLKAYSEEFGDNITDRFVLRLGKTDGKFEPWHLTADTIEADFAAFLAALELYKQDRAGEERFSAMKRARTARKRKK